jgi:hypothetical protein
MADGTYLELHEREPDGIGVWAPTGQRTADLTIIFHDVDEHLVLQDTVKVRVRVEVDAMGDTLTAPYTVEVTAPDGTIVNQDQGIATAVRINVEPMAPLGTPTTRPAATPSA